MVSAVACAGAIDDPDVFWHILIGDQIRATGSLSGLGADWTVVQPERPWETSQWASEVLVSVLHAAAGLQALVVFRAVAALVFMAALAAVLLSRATPRASTIVMAITVLAVVPVFADRPQSASLTLLLWLSWRVSGMLRGDRGPSIWEVAGVTWAWAQFHGLWILVPAAFAVLAFGRLADGSEARPQARRALTLLGVSVLAGVINPVGLQSLLLPFSFARATPLIQEWSRTSLEYTGTVFLLLMLVLIAWLWARAEDRIPRSEFVHVTAWSIFAFLAIRNVTPAMLLLAPVVAARLSVRLPSAGSGSEREQRGLRITVIAVLVLGSIAAIGRAATIDPLADNPALELSRVVARSEEPVRVLNDYNASGILLYTARDKVTLAIDGRADRLGGTYSQQSSDAEDLRGAWREYVSEANADLALLRTDRALTTWLRDVEGWTVVNTDNGLTLLARTKELARALD